MPEYKVFADKILVLRDPKPDDSNAAIILTDEIESPPSTGKIRAVGEEVLHCKVGDRIVFGQYAGHFLKTSTNLEDTDLIVMREDEVLAIEKAEEPDETA